MSLDLLKNLLFPKKPFYNLGVCRILFYGLTLKELWSNTYTVKLFYHSQLLPRELWTPVGIFHLYPKDMLFSLIESHLLLNLLCVCLFFTMIGFLTRFSSFMSFILALLLLGYPNNFGAAYNSNNLFLVTLFVLIFSNAGHSLSVDNLLKNRKAYNENNKLFMCWSLWTIKLITSLTCLFYFTSGLQKLRLSGLDWVFSDQMAISFMHLGHPVGLFLSQLSIFSIVVAFLGLFTQICSFLPIFLPRLTLLFFFLFCLFHIIIDVTFGTHFVNHWTVLVFLFPWGNLLPQFKGNFRGSFWLSFVAVYKSKKYGGGGGGFLY